VSVEGEGEGAATHQPIPAGQRVLAGISGWRGLFPKREQQQQPFAAAAASPGLDDSRSCDDDDDEAGATQRRQLFPAAAAPAAAAAPSSAAGLQQHIAALTAEVARLRRSRRAVPCRLPDGPDARAVLPTPATSPAAPPTAPPLSSRTGRCWWCARQRRHRLPPSGAGWGQPRWPPRPRCRC